MINAKVYEFMRDQKFEHIPVEQAFEFLAKFDDDCSAVCRKCKEKEVSKKDYLHRLSFGYSVGINRTEFCKEANENKRIQEELSHLLDSFVKQNYSG